VFELPKYGDGLCLARLAALLELLAIDRTRLQQHAVVVTGSNGKGSVAAMCAGIGRALGLRTGLFTSPHLYRFNERFAIDGVPIGDGLLTELVERVATAITHVSRGRGGERFGAFEAQFALACLYFQEAGCAFMVFEAGIGGRYDPVRLVGARLTCVTSVDLEHTELLGGSLELIASDKSDACAAGGTVVYGENLRGLRGHLAEYNRGRGVTGLFVREEIALGEERMSAAGQSLDVRFDRHGFDALELALPGTFQFNNAAIAVAMVLLWLRQERPDAAPAAIEAAVRAGLRETRWAGRIETIRQAPLTVIDVGHTPDGVRQALRSLQLLHGDEEWILVLGVSRDKNVADIAALLAGAFGTIVCTAAHHKGAEAERIAAAARAANPAAEVVVAGDIAAAVAVSTQLALASGRRIYVAGGLFVAVEYATVVRVASRRLVGWG